MSLQEPSSHHFCILIKPGNELLVIGGGETRVAAKNANAV